MQKLFLLASLLMGLSAPGWAQEQADSRAVAVADEMVEAMGGQTAWDHVRYLRFDFVVEREGAEVARVRHLWDRHLGRYRVEWKDREGRELQAFFNVNTRSGRVWVRGEPARDEDEQTHLDRAYGRFINDTYWLLMPWKLKDPGVKLEYVGERRLAGQTYDLLHLSFDNVGLTPGDHYWVYVNRTTRRMDRWAYFLQSFEGAPSLEKATPWRWQEWEDFGGLRLSREKVQEEGGTRIHFPVLAVLERVDDRVFESPETALPGEP